MCAAFSTYEPLPLAGGSSVKTLPTGIFEPLFDAPVQARTIAEHSPLVPPEKSALREYLKVYGITHWLCAFWYTVPRVSVRITSDVVDITGSEYGGKGVPIGNVTEKFAVITLPAL